MEPENKRVITRVYRAIGGSMGLIMILGLASMPAAYFILSLFAGDPWPGRLCTLPGILSLALLFVCCGRTGTQQDTVASDVHTIKYIKTYEFLKSNFPTDKK